MIGTGFRSWFRSFYSELSFELRTEWIRFWITILLIIRIIAFSETCFSEGSTKRRPSRGPGGYLILSYPVLNRESAKMFYCGLFACDTSSFYLHRNLGALHSLNLTLIGESSIGDICYRSWARVGINMKACLFDYFLFEVPGDLFLPLHLKPVLE